MSTRLSRSTRRALAGLAACLALIVAMLVGSTGWLHHQPGRRTGQQALDYVGQRYGLPEGGLDRVRRQQLVPRPSPRSRWSTAAAPAWSSTSSAC
jgi:hypothetical protein